MPRRRAYRAVTRIDPKTLADFQAGIRKRYSDEQILDELRACAGDPGVALARSVGRLARFARGADARAAAPSLLTGSQVYRMFDARRGAWSTFQFLIPGRLLEEGAEVSSDGRLSSARPRRSG